MKALALLTIFTVSIFYVGYEMGRQTTLNRMRSYVIEIFGQQDLGMDAMMYIETGEKHYLDY